VVSVNGDIIVNDGEGNAEDALGIQLDD